MNYGKAFKEIREEKKASRQIVAKALGITTGALWKIENQKTIPKTATIRRFCENYCIPLARFYMLALEPSDF